MDRWVILDLPAPLEPVSIDLTIPLEVQLPPGIYLEAARELIRKCLERR